MLDQESGSVSMVLANRRQQGSATGELVFIVGRCASLKQELQEPNTPASGGRKDKTVSVCLLKIFEGTLANEHLSDRHIVAATGGREGRRTILRRKRSPVSNQVAGNLRGSG